MYGLYFALKGLACFIAMFFVPNADAATLAYVAGGSFLAAPLFAFLESLGGK